MAIDTAERRRSVSGVPFSVLGPGVTPSAAKDGEWRQQVAWSYSGILAGDEVIPEPVPEPVTGHSAGHGYSRAFVEFRRRKLQELKRNRQEEQAALEAAKKLQRDIRRAQEGELSLPRVEEQAEKLDRLIAAQSSLQGRVERVIGAIQVAQAERSERAAQLVRAAQVTKQIKEALERQIEDDEESEFLLRVAASPRAWDKVA